MGLGLFIAEHCTNSLPWFETSGPHGIGPPWSASSLSLQRVGKPSVARLQALRRFSPGIFLVPLAAPRGDGTISLGAEAIFSYPPRPFPKNGPALRAERRECPRRECAKSAVRTGNALSGSGCTRGVNRREAT